MRILLTVGMIALLGGALSWRSSRQRQSIPFVDAHIHLNEPDSALTLLNRAGVTRAIVFIGAQGSNDDVLRAARRSGDRLIPFASISPERREYRARWLSNDTSLVAELDQMLEGGAYRGIGEISVVHFGDDGSASAMTPAGTAARRTQRVQARSRDSSALGAPAISRAARGSGAFPETDFDPSGPVMRGIMRVAERRHVPVLIHCEVTRLREFSALLEAFPAVPVIWAHGGYTPLVLASRMLDKHPNLVYELSARTWSQHPRSPDYTVFRDDSLVWPEWLALIERHGGRFIVGTDAALRSMENDRRKIDRVRLLLAQLSDTTRRRVASENALRLVAPLR